MGVCLLTQGKLFWPCKIFLIVELKFLWNCTVKLSGWPPAYTGTRSAVPVALLWPMFLLFLPLRQSNRLGRLFCFSLVVWGVERECHKGGGVPLLGHHCIFTLRSLEEEVSHRCYLVASEIWSLRLQTWREARDNDFFPPSQKENYF